MRHALWNCLGPALLRLPVPWGHGWRRAVLRLGGARVGRGVRVGRAAVVRGPWNLRVGDGTRLSDRAMLTCDHPVRLGAGVLVSERAHLCAAPEAAAEPPGRGGPTDLSIHVGDGTWIGAAAFVGAGARVGARCRVAMRTVVRADVPPGQTVAGDPARTVEPPDAAAP